MDASAQASHRRLLLGSFLVAALVTSALLATSPGLPMVWDEGDAILRAEEIPHQWPYTTRREGHPAFYGIVIAAGKWAAAGIASLLPIPGGGLRPLDAARLGPMLLFGLAAGAMFYRMWRQYSAAAAAAAVGALVLLPRMFAHAHFASLDGPLTSCWILAWATFAPAVAAGDKGPVVGEMASRRMGVAAFSIQHSALSVRRPSPFRLPLSLAPGLLWGTMLGLTLSCKATGWLAPLPFLAWALIYRDRAGAKALAVGLPVALLSFFVLNPPLWQHPLHGWLEFFDLNLHRATRLKLNIPIRFLGQSYHLGHPLPWYNTLLWTAVTVPVGTLALAGIGTIAVFRRSRTDRAGVLLVANWLVLLIVRALPMVPPHDGVRLFLPSFAFLAALAGVGCAAVLARVANPWSEVQAGTETTTGRPPRVTLRWQRAERGDDPRGSLVMVKRPLISGPLGFMRRLAFAVLGLIYRGVLIAVLLLMYAGSVSSLFWYAPQWLSYYNLLIGGLPGATAAGMEPTYYWDGLDRSVLDWLHAHTGPGEKIYFGSAPADNLRLMQRWGMLRRGTQFDPEPGEFRWYVMQHRPGPWPWQPIDPWLIKHCRPAYRKTIRPPARRAARQHAGLEMPWPWRLDVPLVEVYRYQDYVQARDATRGRDIGQKNPP